MTFEEYIDYSDKYYRDNISWCRRGQAYMLCLYEANRRLYDDVTGTSLDVFHKEEMIFYFCDYLLENWDD